MRFAREEACREYLSRLRWPDGFRCPRCGSQKSSPVRTILLRCGACRHQTSVIAGTIFQDTRTPLHVWFQAMWWITTQKNGASVDDVALVASRHCVTGTGSADGQSRGG